MRILPALPLLCLLGCPGPREAPAGEAPAASPSAVTASPALAEMVFAIGAGDHLSGVSRYCSYPPACAQLPRIGGILDPNLEAIDALAPDLVLWQGKTDRLEELCRLRGYDLQSFPLETTADVLAALTRLGALLDCEQGAAREVARLRAALRPRPLDGPRPRVLLVYERSPGDLGQLSSVARGTFLSECLEAAGGQNCLDQVAPGSWPMLSPEVAFEARPDVIVELHSRALSAAEAARLRQDWAGLEEIPAVAAGRIAVVCGQELLLPGPRLDQVVDALARALRGQLDVGLAPADGAR